MKTLYQTLEDKDNPDFVEEYGPFLCKAKGAWLGEGYYYWESFLEYARWWGETRYKRKGYFICESKVDFKRIKVLDLLDTDTIKDLINISKDWYDEKHEDPTVPQVIEYMREDESFNYQAIRARVENATNESSLPDHRMYFNPGYSAYLELLPQIQVCVLDKRIIGEDNFHIVYPPMYVG